MTKYHYCLLLMGSLLLGSCQSVEQLSIDYMLPAEVSFPATLKRVAVVNNMPNVPDNKLIITEEEQKKSENEVARLTNYYNGDAAITTESLAEALANENYFEEVVICDSALRSKVYAKEENWSKAVELWKQTYETKKGKQKMYAAYNTALGYEMQDSIDTALEWALKAQTLAREKSKTDKKETGEIHDGTISYYIFISMYVDELEKRKEGMARLNMQMNRFDDDF